MHEKKIRIAINGAGRIGRAFIRLAFNNPNIEFVAINDLGDIENIAYLMRYDTAYGVAPFEVKAKEDQTAIIVNGKEIRFLNEKDPALLPWQDLNVDIVIEATGVFTAYEKARDHITAGAKRVVITAPAKGEPKDETEVMVLMGINDEKLEKSVISSNASCTTNAISPVIQILNEKIGIEKAILNTTHAYTASQAIVDGPNKKDWKEGRAGAQNIIPTSTGAAKALTKIITDLEGKFDGLSMRVPVVAGSIADVTFISKRETTVEEVNKVLKEATREPRWQGIYTVAEDLIVSSDIIGSLFGSIADLGLTKVIDGNLVKVCAWYDNEIGYTNTLIKHVLTIGKYL
ncbi:MAG: type I glyceraldehyde-3-phosphate dehydrogenase [Parcubacteria group bacterium]|nr:type I glyceraldehyde-3-phosphate dehydrogenase [Parcubacteria group bacterium]